MKKSIHGTTDPVPSSQLIYSPDEGVYYWQVWGSDWRVSQPFKTRAAALRAKERGTLRFE
jgi:hypothetical protein